MKGHATVLKSYVEGFSVIGAWAYYGRSSEELW